jgi:SEC-C motif-containing protein
MSQCPCGSGLTLESCCGPIIGGQPAPTAEALMRARYTAYVQKDIHFIMDSTLKSSREDSDEAAMRAWAEQSVWQGLEILGTEAGSADDNKGKVEFQARYVLAGVPHLHHEMAEFSREDGKWFFRDADIRFSGPTEKPKPVVNELKIGRNDPCHCGSGKKFKKCHGA